MDIRYEEPSNPTVDRGASGVRRIVLAGTLICVTCTLAIAAQSLLVGRGDQSSGILLYLLAAVAFALSVRAARSLPLSSAHVDGAVAVRPLLFVVPGMLMVATLATENVRPLYPLAIILWIASMATAAYASSFPLPARPRVSEWGTILLTRARRPEMPTLLVITIGGSALRLFALADFPSGIHGDESEFGLIARSVLAGNGPNPFGTAFFGDPALFVYLEAPFLALFGNSLTALRLCAAVFGILTIPAFYLFLRSAFGSRPALTGAALLAGSAAHVHYSRLALN
ncbi:MAG TPA: glycosyltransferase family 39 protein, partial [Chloroflexota bacterium]|nr:glycosyltransferase family 39 protein [Chloroflexota bacterium]